jgi:hypothetical protein
LGSSHWNRSVNVDKLLHFLNWHTPFAWLVLAAVLASLWFAIDPGADRRLLAALWLFVPAAAAFILAMKPLIDHHLVILAVAIAPAAGASLGLAASRLRRELVLPLLLFAAVFVVVGTYQQHRQLGRLQREPAWVHVAANWLRTEARPDEVVATDIPILAYYAHRRLVPNFVDTSFTRLGVGDLSPAEVFRELDRYHVRVAAIGRAFWVDPPVQKGFNARFSYRKWHPNIVYYLGRRRP